jgi:hypothetical protein
MGRRRRAPPGTDPQGRARELCMPPSNHGAPAVFERLRAAICARRLFAMSSLQLELNDPPRSARPLHPGLEDRNASESPVFVDDAGRRRGRVRLIALGLAVAAVLWLVAVAASFVGFGPLPNPVLKNDRPEPAAAGSKPFSGAPGPAREPNGDRTPATLRSSGATPSTDGVKGAPAARRRPPAASGEPAPRIRTGRAALVERRPNRPSSRSPDAVPAPTPAPPPAGRPGGGSPVPTAPQAPAPQAPAPPATTEPAPTTPASGTPPRVTPTASPEQRAERAAGDPALGKPLDGRPADAGPPGS